MKLSRRLNACLATFAMVAASAPLMQLEAAAAPTPTASNAAVKLAHEATSVWGTFPGGANITVWTETKVANGSWSRSQVGTTDANGGYTLALTYGTGFGGDYEFRVGGTYADGTTVYTDAFTLTRLGVPNVSTAGERHVGVESNAWGTISGASNVATWTEVELSDDNWSRSQSTTANEQGRYVLPLTYGADTPGTYTFRVVTRHDDGTVVYSEPFDFVRFGGTITANAASSKVVGESTNVTGSFSHGPGIDVWTEVKLASGSWSRSQRSTTDASGSYSIPLTYGSGKAGDYRFRVAGRYPDGHVARSREFVLKRTEPVRQSFSSTASGTKYDWMRAAGIPESEWQYVDYIVTRESSWNPRAVNRYSGACGLAQAYPCSKLGPNWHDPVVALKWQYNYVTQRYGGYRQAYNFWVRNRWY